MILLDNYRGGIGFLRGKAKSLIITEAGHGHLPITVSRKASGRGQDNENSVFWLKRDATLQGMEKSLISAEPIWPPSCLRPSILMWEASRHSRQLHEIYLNHTTCCALCEEIQGALVLLPGTESNHDRARGCRPCTRRYFRITTCGHVSEEQRTEVPAKHGCNAVTNPQNRWIPPLLT